MQLRARSAALIAVASLAACSVGRPAAWSPASATQAPYRYRVREEGTPGASMHLLTGVRSLAHDLWQPADDELVLGMGFAIEPPRSACGFEAGFQYARYLDQISAGAGVHVITVEQAELFVGARKTFWQGEFVQPYVGGGATLIDVTAQGSRGMSTLDDNDRSLTAYLHAGLLFRIHERFRLGIDARSVRGDVDYDQLALVFEWSF